LQPTAATFLVVAPPGLQERSYAGRDRSLKWQEAEPSLQVDVGDLRCRFSATDHGPPTFAVRFDRIGQGPGGPPLVYSADTGPGWSVDELGEDIGTFLCEATYLKDQEGTFGHLSGRQAGSMARDASVAQLVVTHRRPTVEAEALGFEAAEAFGREVHQAVPGVVFEW
jgi:ribonuclease BN (tRNA processing enzyme)